MPDKVPFAVPNPFWQQAEYKDGATSPKAGDELRDKHNRPDLNEALLAYIARREEEIPAMDALNQDS